jgi:TDG/mug DNA glycosylase family protein
VTVGDDAGSTPGARRMGWTVSNSDILASGLDVVFCGLNPALTAVADRHNFSHPSNRFWSVLHLAGFTDVRLRPQEERRLLEYGCGITAVVGRPTSRADEVAASEFRGARAAFTTKMARYAPTVLAFLGKRAVAAMMNDDNIAWGRHPLRFAGSAVWILPNPSGLNRSFSLEDLVRRYADLRSAIDRTDADAGVNANAGIDSGDGRKRAVGPSCHD